MLTFTREQTDQQYNPILWTRRLPADELLPAHVEFTTTRSDSYRERLGEGLSSMSFGAGEMAGTADVYRPAGLAEGAPIVVYLHGGWWQWFSKEQFGYVAEPFNAAGYAVVMPGYRLAQDWQNGKPMESILRQMEGAVAAVLQDAVERGAPAVHVVGHSAGGHLAAMLHQTDWTALGLSAAAQAKFRGAFSLAGLFDLRPLVDSYVNDAIGMSLTAAERVSPQLLPVPAGPRPLHLVLPEYDTPEFFRQTKEHQEKLLRAGLQCDLHVAARRDHLDLIERLPTEGDELLGYILNQMAQAEMMATSRSWIESF
ncbi:MAG: alpha/beta hydrolase, partial [Planctomycetota bacterium]